MDDKLEYIAKQLSKEDLHAVAWDMFGKEKCDRCGMTLKKHKKLYKSRFHMHNRLNPKDYTILEAYAWQCLCSRCHGIVEAFYKKWHFEEHEMIVVYDQKDLYNF